MEEGSEFSFLDVFALVSREQSFGSFVIAAKHMPKGREGLIVFFLTLGTHLFKPNLLLLVFSLNSLLGLIFEKFRCTAIIALPSNISLLRLVELSADWNDSLSSGEVVDVPMLES